MSVSVDLFSLSSSVSPAGDLPVPSLESISLVLWDLRGKRPRGISLFSMKTPCFHVSISTLSSTISDVFSPGTGKEGFSSSIFPLFHGVEMRKLSGMGVGPGGSLHFR